MMKEITIAATRRGNLARRIVRLGQTIPAIRRRDRVALGRIYRSTLSERFSYPLRVEAVWIDVGKTRVEVLRGSSGAVASGAALHLHGGAFIYPYNDTYRRAALEIFDRTGMTVYSPDYRIAPAHPYPAALDDAVATYRRILADGVPGNRIAVIGDSAGGGLCLSLVMRLREMSLPLPGAIVTFSAWTDLAMTGSSIQTNAGRDPMFGEGSDPLHPERYAGSTPFDNPLVSPKYGTFDRFPPLLMHVGGFEIILSDTLDVAAKADAAGVDVTVMRYEGMFHGFQLGFGLVPEAKQAWSATGGFIKTIFGAESAPDSKGTTRTMTDTKEWFRLDNAAKIFPAISTKKETNTFRIQIALTEPIDPEGLQKAVDAAIERYPLFKVRLKNGFFWKYLDYNDAPFTVQPLPHIVCGSLLPKEHNGYLFQIYYRGPLFVLEMFHSLADGSGAIMFVKTILYEYLTSIGKKITPDNLILTRDSKPTKAEYEDSQATYYDPKNHAHVKEDKAFFVKGTPIPNDYIGLIAGTISTEKMLSLARSRQATATEYL
ncbi:MAG: alpha/beta hydrolase, partial [Bacillota bacterium]|nr:alpha/beta hydrolase [Bacillota bacterium]